MEIIKMMQDFFIKCLNILIFKIEEKLILISSLELWKKLELLWKDL